MKRILTNEDIKKIWEKMIIVTLDNVTDLIAGGGVKPVIMSNGYMASMSIDVLSENISMYHLSINNPKGKTGIVTAQKMAYEIFGEGYVQLNMKTISGCVQFIKEKVDKNDGNNNLNINKDKKEAKLNDGKVEGDIKHGVEGRIKKEIQTKGIVERPNRDWENVFGSQSSRICSGQRMESSIS